MAKNPLIAAGLNFLIWGVGYLYLGKRNPGYYLIPFWIAGLIIFALIHEPTGLTIIQGNVLDYNIKDPLTNVNISIYNYADDLSNPNSDPICQTRTDSRGSYRFRDIAPGRYIIIFSKEKYNVLSNYIDIVEKGYAYELNAVLIPEGGTSVKPTYLIPEMIILEKLGVSMPKDVEIFTWVFAISISIAFAIDAFREARKRSV
jgi:hypothetical protein